MEDLGGGGGGVAPFPGRLPCLAKMNDGHCFHCFGEVLRLQGDSGDRFYLIESGSVVVTKGDMEIARLSMGDFFGEIALIKDIPRTATVTTATDVVLFSLDKDGFKKMLESNLIAKRLSVALDMRIGE